MRQYVAYAGVSLSGREHYYYIYRYLPDGKLLIYLVRKLFEVDIDADMSLVDAISSVDKAVNEMYIPLLCLKRVEKDKLGNLRIYDGDRLVATFSVYRAVENLMRFVVEAQSPTPCRDANGEMATIASPKLWKFIKAALINMPATVDVGIEDVLRKMAEEGYISFSKEGATLLEDIYRLYVAYTGESIELWQLRSALRQMGLAKLDRMVARKMRVVICGLKIVDRERAKTLIGQELETPQGLICVEKPDGSLGVKTLRN